MVLEREFLVGIVVVLIWSYCAGCRAIEGASDMLVDQRAKESDQHEKHHNPHADHRTLITSQSSHRIAKWRTWLPFLHHFSRHNGRASDRFQQLWHARIRNHD